MAIVAVAGRYLRVNKGEVNFGGDTPQRMIGAHTFLKVDFIAEEFHLRLMHAHHSDEMTDVPAERLFKRNKMIYRFGQHALEMRPHFFCPPTPR